MKKRTTGLGEFLDYVCQKLPVDKNRVCVTGLSMGGFGAWKLAAKHPNRFSCIVPICGAGEVEDAAALKSTPVWAFHGVDDRVFPIKGSTQIVDAIKAAGNAKVRLTTLEHVGHNSWSPAYAMHNCFSGC